MGGARKCLAGRRRRVHTPFDGGNAAPWAIACAGGRSSLPAALPSVRRRPCCPKRTVRPMLGHAGHSGRPGLSAMQSANRVRFAARGRRLRALYGPSTATCRNCCCHALQSCFAQTGVGFQTWQTDCVGPHDGQTYRRPLTGKGWPGVVDCSGSAAPVAVMAPRVQPICLARP